MPDFESTEKLPSTKANKNHGYGTEIIRSIVQKYDGDVLFTCKDRKFSTALSIRIKRERSRMIVLICDDDKNCLSNEEKIHKG